MKGRFKGKTIIITGAGSGLGRNAALRLAEEGADLSLVDVCGASLEDTHGELLEVNSGSRTLLMESDVSKESDVRHYVEKTLQDLGRIDGLYNNAGVEGRQKVIADYDFEEFKRVVDTNLAGVFLGMKYTLPVMVEQGSGAIVNASSVAGIRAVPYQVGYGATKHGVAGMTKDAAIEYGQYGISINAIAPGAIMTPMVKDALIQQGGEEGWEEAGLEFISSNPMQRFGQPEEVASLVAYLLSQEAKFINGTIIPIDGGQSQAY